MESQAPDPAGELEARIAAWRTYLRRRRTIEAADADELEDHLRNQVSSLTEAGLATDEAFLVAVKRLGELDVLTREFAREHSDRLWKQLVAREPSEGSGSRKKRTEAVVALGLAVAAAAASKLPALAGFEPVDGMGKENFYARNGSLFVLPCLVAYLAWKRRIALARCIPAAIAFGVAAALVNAIPFELGGSTEVLAVLHLPIALWLVVGIAYSGGNWRDRDERMNFVRFSGELFIYYVLIGLGGGVLTFVTMFMFQSVGLDAEWFAQEWILPCGAAGAAIVAAWLVEAKQSVVENMAPVLTRLFTPLFAAVLLAFLGTMAWTGNAIELEREVLIGFDLLLAVVLGLLLFAVSARDPRRAPDAFDALQLTLVLCALIVDAVALAAIAARISEFGFSANKMAALGENLVLLVNLSWSAWLYTRFLRGRGTFDALARWQTGYLPAYSAWAAFVVIAFPPMFGFA